MKYYVITIPGESCEECGARFEECDTLAAALKQWEQVLEGFKTPPKPQRGCSCHRWVCHACEKAYSRQGDNAECVTVGNVMGEACHVCGDTADPNKTSLIDRDAAELLRSRRTATIRIPERNNERNA